MATEDGNTGGGYIITDPEAFLSNWSKLIDHFKDHGLERIYISEDEFDCIWNGARQAKLGEAFRIDGSSDSPTVGQCYLYDVPIEQDYRLPMHGRLLVLSGGKKDVPVCPVTEPSLPV